MLAVELVSITIILIVHINNVRIRNYLNVCRGYIYCVAKSTNFRDATTGLAHDSCYIDLLHPARSQHFAPLPKP